MEVIIVFTVFALCRSSVAFGSNAVIGQSFYVPRYDLLGENLLGGYRIFKHLHKDCIGEQKGGIIQSFSTYFKDTESFLRSISTDTNIAVSINSFGFTLDATTKSVSGNERNVTGLTYTDYSKTKEEYLEQSCLPKIDLDDSVVSSFEKLPSSVDNPSLRSGWTAYENFFKIYGSHFVTRVSYGSSLYQYAFTQSSMNYNKQDFTIKACAGISSTGNTILNVSVCSGVTKQEIEKASSMNIQTRFVARGGNLETRKQLYYDRSDKKIAEFLGEAKDSNEPISYKFTPIWEILSYKYEGTEQYPKVVILRSYYQGFLNYPCDYTKENHAELRKFRVIGSKLYPVFQCIIAPIGCQTAGDCKVYSGFWSNDCFCKNNDCVKHKTIRSITGDKQIIAYFDEKSWDNSWHGYCKISNNQCYCHNPRSPKVVWTSDNNKMMKANRYQREEL